MIDHVVSLIPVCGDFPHEAGQGRIVYPNGDISESANPKP